MHVIISAFAIFYSVYLAYIFIIFKNKKILVEYIMTISFFILLLQRQNIFICLLLFLNMFLASKRKIKKNERVLKRIYKYLLIIIILSILLYGFGVVGNMRYGNKWAWNDSSMISILGKMNQKYPSFLPKEFFWSYVYIVSPLSNLNENVINIRYGDNVYYFIMEFIPEIIRNNLFSSYVKQSVLLPVTSLNASTSYVRVYNYFGYIGLYIMYFVQMLICLFTLILTYKNQRKYFNVVCNIVTYFLIFSFFENTIVYSTTALLIMYCILCNIKIKKRR